MGRPITLVLACSLLALSCARAGGSVERSIAPVATETAPEPAAEGNVSAPARVEGVAALGVGLPGNTLENAEAAYVQLAAHLARGSSLTTFTGPLNNWPIDGRISSPYGPRWGGYHNGLDIAAPMFTPVRAAAAGQIVAVGKPSLVYGDTATIVIIVHGAGFATLYAHLNDEKPPVVKTGDRVAAGQVIAYNGTTGWSTGPHVHFMTIVGGRAMSPLQYLP